MTKIRMPRIWAHAFQLMLAALLFFGTSALAEAPSGDETTSILVSREAIEVPGFDALSDRPLIDFYTNESDYDKARLDDRFVFEKLTYLSDGLDVVAFLYRPRDAGKAMKTIVFNRGSYVRNDAAPEYLSTFHRLAQSGFVVLAPMYRGSEGAPGHDEMGGKDLDDLMRIADLANELACVDAQGLYLMGESRGGMMVLQALRDGFPTRAAAVYGAPTDFLSLLEDYPDRYADTADQLWPGWRENRDEVLGRRSAVTWADKIDTPLLIMQGGDDQSIPVSQSLSLATRLNELGKPFELHVFGGEGHTISGRATERDRLAARWFDSHAGD